MNWWPFTRERQRTRTLTFTISSDQSLPDEVWSEILRNNADLLIQSADLNVDDPRVQTVQCTLLVGGVSVRRTIKGPDAGLRSHTAVP